jgi:hypothetical protein
MFLDNLLYHGFILPHFSVEETVLLANAGAPARREATTPLTLYAVASAIRKSNVPACTSVAIC